MNVCDIKNQVFGSVARKCGFLRQANQYLKCLFYFAIFFLTINSVAAQDCDKNWVLVRHYDENGTEIGTQKSYFDNNGKPTQNQVKNESRGQVLATQTLYDFQGRSAVQTLAAPIGNSVFKYNNNFVTSGGTAYNYLNFDGDPANTSNPTGKLNTPDAVDNAQQGSLGWYYSDNNTLEPMVGATSFPYTRTDYYQDGSGAAKRSSGVGEQLKMGTGHEVSSTSFPVQHELDKYMTIRNKYFATAAGSSPLTLSGQGLQTIATDQNGLKVLTVTDLSGKQVLMTARADAAGALSIQNTLSMTNVTPSFIYTFTEGASLGFPVSYETISCDDPTNIVITCTSCAPQTQVYSGPGNGYTLNANPNASYSIASLSPFYISEFATSPDHRALKEKVAAAFAEPGSTSFQYFQLGVPSAVTVTGSFKLFNMLTETEVAGFSSGNTLQPGYYKILATQPAALNAVNTVTVTYTNKYTDVSFNFYNQLGQTIASITPNGSKILIPSDLS
ncbi:hypothetical protein, partial [Mucilaginibacter flavidus]|uniref:hypothetical protein n=1 Tax=Mucilaginibacter flavidus TaxID=2949309 RepID=UPI0020929A6E